MVTVDYMLLADAAAAAEGKLYIHGAGWDSILAASFPFQHPQISVVLLLRVPWADTNEPHRIEIDVLDQDGKSVLPEDGAMKGNLNAGRPVNISPGEDQVFPVVLNIGNLQFEKEGSYVIVFKVDGAESARTRFRVRMLSFNLSMSAAPPGPPQ